jgi:hypothetical protein
VVRLAGLGRYLMAAFVEPVLGSGERLGFDDPCSFNNNLQWNYNSAKTGILRF